MFPSGVTLSRSEGSLSIFTGASCRQRGAGVTLSAAKGLSPSAARCFAELTLSAANVLSMTMLYLNSIGSSCLLPNNHFIHS
jgi:hypothetical protein